MKKILAAVAVVLGMFSANAADLNLHYKGYVETFGGLAVPQYMYDGGGHYGIQTSHGVEMLDGLFLGLGLNLGVAAGVDQDYRYADVEYNFLGAMYLEGRYNFLRGKRISPFVGMRLGLGVDSYYDLTTSAYVSPMAGCTFNLTERFGLDVGLQYSFWSGKGGIESHRYDLYYTGSGNTNAISLVFGLHF